MGDTNIGQISNHLVLNTLIKMKYLFDALLRDDSRWHRDATHQFLALNSMRRRVRKQLLCFWPFFSEIPI